MEWKLIEEESSKKVNMAERFFLGNGYLFSLGAEEEYRQIMIPAQSLAGIIHAGEDGWRTFSRMPNPFHMSIADEKYSIFGTKPLHHKRELDCRHGILFRQSVWETAEGKFTVTSERFLSRKYPHAALMRYRIQADFPTEIVLRSGIDTSGENEPECEYEELRGEAGAPTVLKVVSKKGALSLMEAVVFPEAESQWTKQGHEGLMRHLKFQAEAGREYEVTKYVTGYLRQDTELYNIKNTELMEELLRNGYEKERSDHCAIWDSLWEADTEELRFLKPEEFGDRLLYSRYLIKCIKGRKTYG